MHVVHTWSVDFDIAVDRAMNVNVLSWRDGDHQWLATDAPIDMWALILFATFGTTVVTTLLFDGHCVGWLPRLANRPNSFSLFDHNTSSSFSEQSSHNPLIRIA